MLGKLAFKSLIDRKGSVLLALMAMTVSIFVLLSVEHIRHQAKTSFAHTVSGVDLIVGAKTGGINLLLYSVFRIGSPTDGMSWHAYEELAASPKVKWAVPISLGDSHKGYRVLGTTPAYFEYYRYGLKHALTFAQGQAFDDVFDVVLGAAVAKRLGYQLGDEVVLAHGVAETSFSMHDDKPFHVSGILAPTGTPVDHTLHVSLQGIEAIHEGWQSGVKVPSQHRHASKPAHQDHHEHDGTQHEHDHHENEQEEHHAHEGHHHLVPNSITAVMLGLKSKASTFIIQQQINRDNTEPLSAILPGVTLTELWQTMRLVENTLFVIAILVFIAACLGVSAMLLASIRERRQEIQLLRVIGAPPKAVLFMIELEALFITLLSVLLATGLLLCCIAFAQSDIASNFGLYVNFSIFSVRYFMIVGLIIISACTIALLPAIYAFKQGIQISR